MFYQCTYYTCKFCALLTEELAILTKKYPLLTPDLFNRKNINSQRWIWNSELPLSLTRLSHTPAFIQTSKVLLVNASDVRKQNSEKYRKQNLYWGNTTIPFFFFLNRAQKKSIQLLYSYNVAVRALKKSFL